MEENPLKYSDFIKPDETITNLVAQLEQLKGSLKEIRTDAEALKAAMTNVSGATNENRESTKKAAETADRLAKAEKELAFAQSEKAKQLAALKLQIRDVNNLNKQTALLNSSTEASYNKLAAQYALNKAKINEMSASMRENTEAGKTLVTETNAIYQKMIQMQEITGKHILSVGHYEKGYNGLAQSISQVARELPNAAISSQIFFMAISNNIAGVSDAINILKAKNIELQKQGLAQVSIWKEVGKAIFSWQTMMMLGVTALTIFGPKIFEFITSLFKSKEAINQAKVETENFTAALREGNKEALKDSLTLKILYDATQNTTKSMEERNEAADELQKMYPEIFGNLTNEEILLGKASEGYNKLAENIVKAARAEALRNQIVKNEEEILKLESESIDKANKSLGKFVSIGTSISATFPVIGDAISKIGFKRYGDELDYAKEKSESLKKANDKLASEISVTDLLFGGKDGGKEKSRVYHDATIKDFDWTIAMDESLAKTLKDGRQKDIDTFNVSIDKKKEKVDDYIDDLLKQQKKINETISQTKDPETKRQAQEDLAGVSAEIKKSEGQKTALFTQYEYERQKGLQDIKDKYDLISLNKQKETLQLQLDAVEEGSQEEIDLRILMLENKRQVELQQNKTATEETRQSEADINKAWDEIILRQSSELYQKKALLEFDNQQKLDESEFNLLRNSEDDKTRFRLKAEKERLQKLLEFNKTAAVKMKDEEVKAMENTIASIDNELKKMGSGVDVYDVFGLQLDDDQKQAISESMEYALGQVSSFMDSRVELANRAAEAANTEVESAQEALDAEVKAKREGYASDVEGAQKRLALAKETQRKALEQQAQAQRAQAAIDTLTQVSSLVTATAKIWKDLDLPWLAIPAIAIMWGSFLAAKVKAKQVTADQKYGEGGLEILEGGSHASGNDIPIGYTKNGKQRKAEGGEAMMIIRKSKTRKYKSMLPGISQALNNGNFEQKYMSSLGGGDVFNYTNNVDLKNLDKNVSDIRKQGERQYFIDSKGRMVMVYKNLRRIVQ